MSNMTRLGKSALVLALMAAFGPAGARDRGSDDGTARAADATPVPMAEVTVSARRRIERAQDVPAPVSVVRGDDLKANLISQVQDLQQALPSTNAAFQQPRVSSLAVRGIGSNPANEGLEGSVGIVIDNVYQGRPGMLSIDLVDLEQVELLRGPQGTLFGKNTTAGVLNLTTKKPTFTPEHSVEVSAGQRGYYQTLVALSGPLSDTVAGRLSLSKTHDGGWLHNRRDGKDYNSIGREGVRAQLLYKPNDAFDLRLIADYNQEDDTQGTLIPYGFGPAAPGKLTWQAATAGALGLPAGSRPLATDPARYDVDFDGPQRVVVYQGGVSAEANWHLASGYHVTSITAARSWSFRPRNDNDVTPADALAGGFTVRHRQASQELRLASPVGRTFDYVLGAYYYHQNIGDDFLIQLGSQADRLLLNNTAGLGIVDNTTGISHGTGTTDSYALFGQANWHVGERLDVTGGLRGTWESKDGRVYRETLAGGRALASYASAAVRNVVAATRASVGGAYDSGDLHLSGRAPSGLATVSYKFTPALLGYVTLSHGEKSGGIAVSGVGSAPTLGAGSLVIAPEKANNVELGVKSAWWNRRLLVNVNYFRTRIQDYQTNAYVAGPVTPVLILTNAGDVKSEGVEFDVKARPLPGLALTFIGSYDDARYTRFTNAPVAAELAAAGVTKADLSGRPVVGAPRWILNPGGRYEWHVSDDVRQYVVVNYAWRSAAEGYIDDSQYARIHAYGLLNVSTGWQFGGERHWDVSLWARNALDKRYFQTAAATQLTGGGGYTASVGAPRRVGVTARLDF